MNTVQMLLTIGAVVLATATTRFLPFLVFPVSKPVPAYIRYLGKVLPYAVLGMLVVYCFKNVSVMEEPFGLPEWIGAAVVAGLHLWKKNMLLSISAGTIIYMLMVQLVF